MNYVLVNSSQLLGQSQIEVFNNFLVTFHVNSPFSMGRYQPVQTETGTDVCLMGISGNHLRQSLAIER
jgi:hypothetical protein